MIQCRGHPILGIEVALDRLVADLAHPAIPIVDRSAAHIANLNRVRPELLRAALLVPWLVAALPRPNDRLTAYGAGDVAFRLRIPTGADIPGFPSCSLIRTAVGVPCKTTRLTQLLIALSMLASTEVGATLWALGTLLHSRSFVAVRPRVNGVGSTAWAVLILEKLNGGRCVCPEGR